MIVVSDYRDRPDYCLGYQIGLRERSKGVVHCPFTAGSFLAIGWEDGARSFLNGVTR